MLMRSISVGRRAAGDCLRFSRTVTFPVTEGTSLKNFAMKLKMYISEGQPHNRIRVDEGGKCLEHGQQLSKTLRSNAFIRSLLSEEGNEATPMVHP